MWGLLKRRLSKYFLTKSNLWPCRQIWFKDKRRFYLNEVLSQVESDGVSPTGHNPRHFPKIIRVAGEKHQHHHQQLQERETQWAIILIPTCLCLSAIIITLTCFCFNQTPSTSPPVLVSQPSSSPSPVSVSVRHHPSCFSQTASLSSPVSVSQPEVPVDPLPPNFSIVLTTLWLSYYNLNKVINKLFTGCIDILYRLNLRSSPTAEVKIYIRWDFVLNL